MASSPQSLPTVGEKATHHGLHLTSLHPQSCFQVDTLSFQGPRLILDRNQSKRLKSAPPSPRPALRLTLTYTH